MLCYIVMSVVVLQLLAVLHLSVAICCCVVLLGWTIGYLCSISHNLMLLVAP